MQNSNELSGVVLLAVSALEDARAWDYKGVTSQDVSMLGGMTIRELATFIRECQEYSHKRARQWLDERKEQEAKYQDWIEAHPEPKNNNADFSGNYYRRLQVEWARQDDRERKGD